MGYIAPNTEIALLKNVPLDASYDHTITFANASTQFTYFRGKVASNSGRIFTLNSYQRTGRNTIRLECTIEEAIQYNYLYFKNTNFENKYFYAFIVAWNYVNNATTEIVYQIDVMQTFMFDYTLKQCFVEREHIQNDYVGANTIPEGLEQGEYVINAYGQMLPPLDMTSGGLVVLATFEYDKTERTFTRFNGEMASGVFTGLFPNVFNSVTQFQTFLEDCQSHDYFDVDKGDMTQGIVAAFMLPGMPASYDTLHITRNVPKKISGNLGTPQDSYNPVNNKLYTFPYNILRIVTDAETGEYRYEDFIDNIVEGDYCQFDCSFTLIPEPVFTATPINYKGSPIAIPNKQERMTVKAYPQVSFDVDVYKVFLAQNAGSLTVGAFSALQTILAPVVKDAAIRFATGGMAGGASGLASANFGGVNAGQIAGLLGNNSVSNNVEPLTVKGKTGSTEVSLDIGDGSLLGVARSLGQLYDIARKPPQMNGTQSSLSDYALGFKQMTVEYLTIKAEYARIIDQYFTMFGYATHRVKVPNIRGRRYFNYVQTKACILEANAPEIYKQQIINIFNRGITFWHTENLTYIADIDDTIGNYSLTNDPV